MVPSVAPIVPNRRLTDCAAFDAALALPLALGHLVEGDAEAAHVERRRVSLLHLALLVDRRRDALAVRVIADQKGVAVALAIVVRRAHFALPVVQRLGRVVD